jgi:hypothetical protein
LWGIFHSNAFERERLPAMRRRQFLTGLLTIALATVFAFSGTALAKGNKNNKNKNGDGSDFTGIVKSITKTIIVVASDTDKTKTKEFQIDDKTQITGDVVNGAKVTVSYKGNKATSIAVASS